MPNPVVHFEIMGSPEQKQALQDFYRQAFDWQIQSLGEMQYGMVEPQGGGIGGAVDASPDGPHVVVYLEVDDANAYLDRVRQAGGEVTMERTVIPGLVTFAQFRDPAGNLMGIVEAEMPAAE